MSKIRNSIQSGEKQQADSGITQSNAISIHQSIHRGPLPAPEQLVEYEKACPGAADRIIKMAENQAAHRQYMERKSIDTAARNSLLGVLCGFVLGMTSILGGVYVAVNGYTGTGYFTMFTGVAALVGVFIYGKKSNREEAIEKQKIMNQQNKD